MMMIIITNTILIIHYLTITQPTESPQFQHSL